MRTLSRFALLAVAAACGCSKSLPPPVPVPEYDPETITAALFHAHDANRDGLLEPGELDRCPALRHAFDAIDTDKDRKLSRAEVTARVTAYKGKLVSATARVTVAGEPAVGYTVTLTPDPAFGPGLKPAAGKTDDMGYAVLKVEGEGALGVPAGLYTATITDAAGAAVEKGPIGREVYEAGRTSTGSLEFPF